MCNSCKNGFNGKNGNGYQPYACKPRKPSDMPISKKHSNCDLNIYKTLLFLIVVGLLLCVSFK